jgi:hypothetical protein
MPKQKPEHYVNNKEFSEAVEFYVKNKEKIPMSNYIGDCFLKIAYKLASKPNFSSYTYKEEMIMDAVENCVKAIGNYDITKTTRTGKPNAFSYFTQITWYAFLRRMQKEKKHQTIREEIIKEFNSDNLIVQSKHNPVKLNNPNTTKNSLDENSYIE